MGNALSSPAGGPPPAPNPNPQDTSGAAPPTPYGSGNALGGPPQGQQPPAPAPTHQQTITALRHFSAIEEELSELLSDPDLGRADLKSKIIDGATRLVSTGILTPADAVSELGSVPERPFDQRQWLEQQFQAAVQGQVDILAHHQAGYGGQDVDTTPPDPANHAGDIAALLSQYKGTHGA